MEFRRDDSGRAVPRIEVPVPLQLDRGERRRTARRYAGLREDIVVGGGSRRGGIDEPEVQRPGRCDREDVDRASYKGTTLSSPVALSVTMNWIVYWWPTGTVRVKGYFPLTGVFPAVSSLAAIFPVSSTAMMIVPETEPWIVAVGTAEVPPPPPPPHPAKVTPIAARIPRQRTHTDEEHRWDPMSCLLSMIGPTARRGWTFPGPVVSHPASTGSKRRETSRSNEAKEMCN